MNKKYNDLLAKARENKYALGAFNVVSKITADAVVKAAEEEKMPVILQISSSTAKKIGVKESLNMLEAARKNAKIPVGIHLDHCMDVEFAKECIKAGFDSVMFDGSHLTFEENIRKTKEIVEYAKKYNCDVEGEVGVIEGVEDGAGSEYGMLASYEDTVFYIEQTGVNTIAPAVGTAHGLYQGIPKINYELIAKLTENTTVPVVIHGGTGLEKEDYLKLIKNGGTKINISTALKYAYLEAIKAVANDLDAEANPLKLDEMITNQLKSRIIHYIEWFKG